jgi:hypothetical protein
MTYDEQRDESDMTTSMLIFLVSKAASFSLCCGLEASAATDVDAGLLCSTRRRRMSSSNDGMGADFACDEQRPLVWVDLLIERPAPPAALVAVLAGQH